MAYVGDWNNHKDLNPHILDWRIDDRDIDKSDQVKRRLDFTGCCDVVFISDPAPELPRALHWAVWAPPLADQLCWGPGHPHPQRRGEHHFYRHGLYLSGSALFRSFRWSLSTAHVFCLRGSGVWAAGLWTYSFSMGRTPACGRWGISIFSFTWLLKRFLFSF